MLLIFLGGDYSILLLLSEKHRVILLLKKLEEASIVIAIVDIVQEMVKNVVSKSLNLFVLKRLRGISSVLFSL